MALYADYPMHLRALAAEYPQVVRDTSCPPKQWTQFQANMLAALAMAKEEDFDLAQERALRRREYRMVYVRKLCVSQGLLPLKRSAEKVAKRKLEAERAAVRANTATFDPRKYKVLGVGGKGFRAFLKRAGLRYTTFAMPHPCPICDEGDTQVAVFTALKREKAEAAIANAVWPAEKQQQLGKLKAQVRLYDIHKLQLEFGRADTTALEEVL